MRLPGTVNWPSRKKQDQGRRVVLSSLVQDTQRSYPLSVFPKAESTQPQSKASGLSRLPKNPTRLASVDDLDEWSVPDWAKALIVSGRDHAALVGKAYKSDSEAQWAVSCELARCGVPPAVHCAVLTDPDFSVSGHVLRQANVERYVQRQIDRAQQVVDAERCLDITNPLATARVFLRQQSMHLVVSQGEFLRWEAGAYRSVEDATMKQLAQRFMSEAVDAKGKPLKLAPRHVNDVVECLRSALHRPADAASPPCFLDGRRDASAGHCIAFPNGILDVPADEFRAPDPSFFTRNALQFDYDRHAPLPTRFMEFLDEILEPEQHSVLQEFFGYLLIPDTSQHKILVVLGPPRSGKSLLGRIITQLVGNANCTGISARALGDRFGREVLIGCQVALMPDCRLHDRDGAAAVEELLKISGEDVVSIDRKFRSAWRGTLSARFVLLSNEMPRFSDSSGALANRLIPLTTKQSFLGREAHRQVDV